MPRLLSEEHLTGAHRMNPAPHCPDCENNRDNFLTTERRVAVVRELIDRANEEVREYGDPDTTRTLGQANRALFAAQWLTEKLKEGM